MGLWPIQGDVTNLRIYQSGADINIEGHIISVTTARGNKNKEITQPRLNQIT